jgi:hypothetical protein
MVYAVDFDGTLCVDKYPEIGPPRYDIINFIKRRRADGDKVILWTCRSGPFLEAALAWCVRHGLEFDAVNDNLADNVACHNNNSRKVCADYYIDDRSIHADDVARILRQTG